MKCRERRGRVKLLAVEFINLVPWMIAAVPAFLAGEFITIQLRNSVRRNYLLPMTEYPDIAYHSLSVNLFIFFTFAIHLLIYGIGFTPYLHVLWQYGTLAIIFLSLNFALYTANTQLSVSNESAHGVFVLEIAAAVAILVSAIYLKSLALYTTERQYLVYTLITALMLQAISSRLQGKRKIRFLRLYMPSLALALLSSAYIVSVVILFG